MEPEFLLEVDAEAPQQITAWIQVYAPVYDMDAPRWQFKFAGGHEYMDISETDIAAKAIERGGAVVDDTYKVLLEIRQTKTPRGQFRVEYKIKKSLRVPSRKDEDPDGLDHR